MDSFRHKGLRKQLVKELREKSINDEAVLAAIAKVPRHLFLAKAFESHAYDDKAFSIGEGQTISQPYTVAYQSAILEIKPGDKVLEIGTGSGYQTAVLCELGAKVFTIERQRKLHDKAKVTLFKLGYKARFVFGDGTIGLPALGPYDKIIVTAGSPQISKELSAQLAKNGKMVIPVGDRMTQTMQLVSKDNVGNLSVKSLENFKFVPLIGEEGWKC
jgi:protein-L-isoaspartate(D-aspartate) O-methyltransferase